MWCHQDDGRHVTPWRHMTLTPRRHMKWPDITSSGIMSYDIVTLGVAMMSCHVPWRLQHCDIMTSQRTYKCFAFKLPFWHIKDTGSCFTTHFLGGNAQTCVPISTFPCETTLSVLVRWTTSTFSIYSDNFSDVRNTLPCKHIHGGLRTAPIVGSSAVTQV